MAPLTRPLEISEETENRITATKAQADASARLRRTASRVLAQAVKAVYPTSKLASGGLTDEGFFLDVEFLTPIKGEDLKKLEREAEELVKADFTVERVPMKKADAAVLMRNFKEPYKEKAIKEADGDDVVLERYGSFLDFGAGETLSRIGLIKAIRLTGVSGAYFLGKKENKMLTRIFGVAFGSKDEFEKYQEEKEAASRRDHNRLGRKLGYFTTVPSVGQGLPVLLPKGAKVIQLLQRFVEDEEEKDGYLFTRTPMLAKVETFKQSLHYEHFKDSIFVLEREKDAVDTYALRPSACAFQFQAYSAEQHSYRDLPLKYSETATLFRNEDSGETHGLIRLRQFTVSDGHIVTAQEDLESAFSDALALSRRLLKTLGLLDDVTYRFGTRGSDKKRTVGSEREWEKAQNVMRTLLLREGVPFTEQEGEASFFGPRLDIRFKNVYGKEDTLVTVQFDFQLAKRFKMTYVGRDGEKKTPVVLHRTSLGCYERTLAFLLEKYEGALPFWLAPEQVRVLSVTEKDEDYVSATLTRLKAAGIRATKDVGSAKIGYKIRRASLDKVPFTLVLGEKERENGTFSVRALGLGERGETTPDEFIAKLILLDKSRAITLE